MSDTTARRIILASASPRRRELLAALVEDFEVIPSNVDEPMTDDPESDAVTLARDKAAAVLAEHPGALVIGSDTVVHNDERAYAKPDDDADAVRMWRELRGRPHQVVTGVAVVSDQLETCSTSAATVTLTDLTDDQVAEYVASGRPADKAGAYAIQDEDVPTVVALDGCYCCVVGLPLWRLRRELARHGVEAREPQHTFARCARCPERA